MAERLKILLIEDKEADAEKMLEQYRKVIQLIEEKDKMQEYLGTCSVELEWLPGKLVSTERNGEKHFFYDESICDEIGRKIEENEMKRSVTGILLDPTLSKEELDKASLGIYIGYKIAREIYEKFKEKSHIFVATQIRDFSSQVMGLMGDKELQTRYLNKHLIIEYPTNGAIARSIRYMCDGEFLTEEQEDYLNQQ